MHILVDIDGVLIRSTYQDSSGTTRFLWCRRLEKDLGINEDSMTLLFNEQWREVITGKRSLEAQVQAFLARLDTPVTVDEFINYWFTHDARLDEQVAALMKQLHTNGHALHIASNQEHMRVDAIRRKYPDLFGLFSVNFLSADLGFKKPELGFYETVLRTLDCKPEEVTVLDDQPKNVDAARQMGMRAIVYDRDNSNESQAVNAYLLQL